MDNPFQIVKNLERLLRKMLAHTARGPVHLALPSDVQQTEVAKDAVPHALPKLVYQPRFVDSQAAMEAFQLMQTAARYGLSILFIVINNNALGNPMFRSEKISPKHAALDQLPSGVGGVGHIAVQLANWAGVYVTTTVGDDAEIELAHQLGAHEVINFKKETAADYVKRITNNNGFPFSQ